ncbi:MAG: TauD/TfdA family dioxygenase [Rhodovibrio sp.]|nr:TauD/TfdA family dioxygenase [Rhodovibrio sp.]
MTSGWRAGRSGAGLGDPGRAAPGGRNLPRRTASSCCTTCRRRRNRSCGWRAPSAIRARPTSASTSRSTPASSRTTSAYRPVALGPHTDNPYREPVPGIQLLHCLVNETTGGLSTLVDSLAVARQLQAEDPHGFDLLATTPVRFRFTDAHEELIERRPIIQRDGQGRMTGVHYSPRLDSLPVMDVQTTRRFQHARQRLGELFVDPAYQISFPLAAGELMMFDNSRVLHGRTSYDPSEGARHLQGCYIDLDGPRSLYRTSARRARKAA